MKYYKSVDDFLKLKLFSGVCIVKNSAQYNELVLILKNYSKKCLRNKLNSILCFIKYDVENSISWCERLHLIESKFKRDSSSINSMLIRYGNKMGNILFIEKNIKTKPSVDKYVSKYGDLGEEYWKLRYKKNGQSLNNYIRKYGNDMGEKKWMEYLNKRKKTYYNNKENGKEYRNGRTLLEYINLYGNDIGTEKYLNRNKKQSYRFSRKYYVEKYGNEIGEKMWNRYKKSMNKTSLISFCIKYGRKEGNKKYLEYCDNQRYLQSLEYYMKRYGKEIGETKYNDFKNKTIFKKQKYSKISQEFFWIIYNKLTEDLKSFVKFAELNKEWFIRKKNKIIFLDFVLKNVVIEFDGEYWHSLKETIKNDAIKNKILLNLGYKLLRIKERDYINNSVLVVERSINFIMENYEK